MFFSPFFYNGKLVTSAINKFSKCIISVLRPWLHNNMQERVMVQRRRPELNVGTKFAAIVHDFGPHSLAEVFPPMQLADTSSSTRSSFLTPTK